MHTNTELYMFPFLIQFFSLKMSYKKLRTSFGQNMCIHQILKIHINGFNVQNHFMSNWTEMYILDDKNVHIRKMHYYAGKMH